MQFTLPSVCPLDCPDSCALDITFENGRMTKLQGSDRQPYTGGFACVKMSKFPLKQEHADRLLYPQRRVGPKGSGEFERIGWDEALDTVLQNVRQRISLFGSQSVLPYSYAGTMGLIERDHPLAFFRGLGASELAWTICASTAGTAWEDCYGPDKLSMAPEDVVHSRLIILWGVNALRSNSHFAPYLKAARKNGALFCTSIHIAMKPAVLLTNIGKFEWAPTPHWR